MEDINLHYNDILVCDPCYIKSVESNGVARFDALKLVKEFSKGDGDYPVKVGDEVVILPVDSGRIWVMCAEFNCRVTLSGDYVIAHAPLDEIKLLARF